MMKMRVADLVNIANADPTFVETTLTDHNEVFHTVVALDIGYEMQLDRGPCLSFDDAETVYGFLTNMRV